MTVAADNLWDRARVAEYLGVNQSTVHRWRIDDPTFPPPIVLSARAVRWRPEQIVAWARRHQQAAPDLEPSRRAHGHTTAPAI